MARNITLRFGPEADVHRLRNFGETLARELSQTDGRLSIEQVDVATDHLTVSAVHSRKLRRVVGIMKALLAAHGIDAELRTGDA